MAFQKNKNKAIFEDNFSQMPIHHFLLILFCCFCECVRFSTFELNEWTSHEIDSLCQYDMIFKRQSEFTDHPSGNDKQSNEPELNTIIL